MFEYYQCDTCKKNIKRVVDNLRPFLSGCTITQNCRGTLRPIPKHQQHSIELSRETWKSRFQEISSISNQTGIQSRLNLMNGKDILTVLSSYPGNSFTLTLQKYMHNDADVNEFMYKCNKDPGYVSGPDDSSFGKILRFTTQDDITVAVNGVAIDRSFFDTSIPNTINISNGIVDNNSEVKIYVSKAQTPIYVQIPFFKNTVTDSKILNGAWKNINYVMQDTNKYWVFHAVNFDALEFNANYITIGVSDNNTNIDDAMFALAVKPYSTYDRSLISTVKISSISNDSMIKYELNDKNETEFSIESSQVISVIPPLSFSTDELDSSYFGDDDDILLVGIGNELQSIHNPFIK